MNFADSLFYVISIWYASNISPIYTSMVVVLFTLPDTWSIFYGPIIQKFNPNKILKYSIIVQVLILSILFILSQIIEINIAILGISILLIVTASELGYNVEEAVIPQLSDEEDLLKVNAFMSITYKISDFLFNGISGILLATLTLIPLLGLNIIFFAIPLIIVRKLNIKFTDDETQLTMKDYTKEILSGIKYLCREELLIILIPIMFLNLSMSMVNVALPLYSRNFKNVALIFGGLMFASGIGGLIGSGLAVKINPKYKVKMLVIMTIFEGIFIGLFALGKIPFVVLFFYLLSKICSEVVDLAYITIFQKIIPTNICGKINTSINTLICILMPIGSLAGGFIIEMFSTKFVMLFYSILCILVGIYYAICVSSKSYYE